VRRGCGGTPMRRSTMRHILVRSSRVVLVPQGWRQVSRMLQRRSRGDGDKQRQWFTGKSTEQPYKPLRREGRCDTACTCGNRAASRTFFGATAPGAAVTRPSLRPLSEKDAKTRAKHAARRIDRVCSSDCGRSFETLAPQAPHDEVVRCSTPVW
jgi:hypothetical protein